MHWDATKISGSAVFNSPNVVANYDYQDGEDHAGGVRFDREGFATIDRKVTHSAWRGTGTPATFQTGIIQEDMDFGHAKLTDCKVKLQTEIYGDCGVRFALNPDEAERLAQTLLYLAKEAREIQAKANKS